MDYIYAQKLVRGPKVDLSSLKSINNSTGGFPLVRLALVHNSHQYIKIPSSLRNQHQLHTKFVG